MNSNFAGAWDGLMSAVGGALGGLLTLAAWIGVIMVVGSIGMWIYRKARGGGGNTSGMVWMIVVGGILCAPNVLIPAILTLVDFIINTISAALNAI